MNLAVLWTSDPCAATFISSGILYYSVSSSSDTLISFQWQHYLFDGAPPYMWKVRNNTDKNLNFHYLTLYAVLKCDYFNLQIVVGLVEI